MRLHPCVTWHTKGERGEYLMTMENNKEKFTMGGGRLSTIMQSKQKTSVKTEGNTSTTQLRKKISFSHRGG